MRSTTRSTRRLRSRAPRHGRLEAIARLVDQSSLDAPGHVLVHVRGEPVDDIELGVKPLDADVHPFAEMAGFTAPPDWWAFGVRARGTARHLDEPGAVPEAVVSTFLVDRTGEAVSILRRGEEATAMREPMLGTIPDLCRRVLGLATAPAPSSSGVLWTASWLDRLLEAWCDPPARRALGSSWPSLASRHPAVPPATAQATPALDHPAHLVRLARAHAEAWPWERLRRHPEVIGLPDGDLPEEIATWMDDGFFARWTLGAYPPILTLAADLRALLGEQTGTELLATVVELLDG